MRVLFVASEMADFVKAGGLGDVASALPRALKARGIDVRILIPHLPEVRAAAPGLRSVATLPGRGAIPRCGIGQLETADGLIVYTLIAPELYDRDGSPYCQPDGSDWPDNDLRFGRLSLAAAQIAAGADLGWRPDILHVNDWPGGLAPAYLRWSGVRVPCVLTVHNLAYQGNFPADRCDALGIPRDALHVNGVEFHGGLSFLKAGLFYANHVCAVSPTYAREITTEALGAGLHGLTQTLSERGQLSGVLNGLDPSWNPLEDRCLPFRFDAENLSGKASDARILRTSLCLAPSQGPLFGIVSRLVAQKGLDLVAETADMIIRGGGQIAILGLGDAATELMLCRLARTHRNDICAMVGFNETMARRIIAASDFCLMPSRFEPCGLTQMQALRYGTLPIAHATGGLADTIEDGVTGFLFPDASAAALRAACQRAFQVFADPPRLAAMRGAAMARRFTWDATAEHYQHLYHRLTGLPVRGRSGADVTAAPTAPRIPADGEIAEAA